MLCRSSSFIRWEPSVESSAEEEVFIEYGEEHHPSAACVAENLAHATLPAITHQLVAAPHPAMSRLQRESVCRVFQSFLRDEEHLPPRRGGGFLLGDATGLGKSRVIAGTVREALARDPSTRTIWFSANTRLRAAAVHELDAVGVPWDDDRMQFLSYASMLPPQATVRLARWIGSHPSSAQQRVVLCVFDESHLLRNQKKAAQRVNALIYRLSDDGVRLHVLYSSATAMSNVNHICYLTRLNLWGSEAFPTFQSLREALVRHGMPLMELFAMHLHMEGRYLCRQLSLDDVDVEHRTVALSAAQRALYDHCAKKLLHTDANVRRQHVFQRLITAFKTEAAIRLTEVYLAAGCSVVISLVNTGDAVAARTADTELSNAQLFDGEFAANVLHMRGDELPLNPVDAIVTRFTTANVAELTGRRAQYELDAFGKPTRQTHRRPLADEIADFQSGKKRIAVLSRAGGVGISLHSSKESNNDARRVHIVLELPWSAEDLTQQVGRTHRAGQSCAPRYVVLSSEIPGEKRFVGALCAKLRAMGALVRGDAASCNTPPSWQSSQWSPTVRRALLLHVALGAARAKARSAFGRPEAAARPMGERDVRARMTERQAAHILTGGVARGARGALANGRGGATRRAAREPFVATRCTLQRSAMDQLFQSIQNDDTEAMQLTMDACEVVFRDACILSDSGGAWSPSAHSRFPSSFRARVRALLLCHHSVEACRTLGALSEDLVHSIIRQMANGMLTCEMSAEMLPYLVNSSRASRPLSHLSEIGVDYLQNRVLTAPIDLQAALFQTAQVYDDAVPPPRHNPCFYAYLRDRAHGAIDSRVVHIAPVPLADPQHRGVCVHVTHTPPPTPLGLPPNAVAYQHLCSGRVLYLDEREWSVVHEDGRTSRVTEEYSFPGYVQVSAETWLKRAQKGARLISKRCERLPTRYTFCTFGCVDLWQHSMQRVLLLPVLTVGEARRMGLLLHVE